ncbi:MAG: hypothetical protein ACREUZ_20930, partial [Burkholderiales bacterium]
ASATGNCDAAGAGSQQFPLLAFALLASAALVALISTTSLNTAARPWAVGRRSRRMVWCGGTATSASLQKSA